MSAPVRAAGEPLISVVIPSCGRPEQLALCLAALAAQDFPYAQFEVIVCDDGTPTPLQETLAPVLASAAAQLPLSFVRQSRSGPAAARNRGAAHARGRYVAFTDDDCVPAPGWISALAARFARAPGHLVGGAMVNGYPANPFSATTQLIMDCAYEYQERRSTGTRFFSTSNLALPAQEFRELGGFSEAFPLAAGEDYDLCARWQHHGLPACYAPEVVVQHAHALTLRKLWRQHFNYGRGLYRMRRRMALRNGTRLRGGSPGFYLALLRYPLRQGHGVRGWLHAVLVALTQVATMTGAAREALRAGSAAPPDAVPRRVASGVAR